MAQFILDCFPDSISQYGLLGCAAPVLALICALCCGYIAGRKT